MRKLAAEAVEAGALGFASSRLRSTKRLGGQPIPSYDAAYSEIEAIARGVDDAGGGLLQFVPDLMAGDYEGALAAVFDVAAGSGPGDLHPGDRQRRTGLDPPRRARHGREGQREWR